MRLDRVTEGHLDNVVWQGSGDLWGYEQEEEERKGCDGAAHTYIADLHLCSLYSQHLWIVCNLSVCLPSVLLILVLIANLHDKQHAVSRQKQCQSAGARQTASQESHW